MNNDDYVDMMFFDIYMHIYKYLVGYFCSAEKHVTKIINNVQLWARPGKKRPVRNRLRVEHGKRHTYAMPARSITRCLGTPTVHHCCG